MDEGLNVRFCFDRTKILNSLSKLSKELICDYEIDIRYLSEEEKENHPDAKFALDMDFYNHWAFWWDGKYRSLRNAVDEALSW